MGEQGYPADVTQITADKIRINSGYTAIRQIGWRRSDGGGDHRTGPL
jgi:hypothetical protein